MDWRWFELQSWKPWSWEAWWRMDTPSDLDSCRNILTGLSASMLSLLLCIFNRVSLSSATLVPYPKSVWWPAEPCVIWFTETFLFTSPNSNSALFHAGLIAFTMQASASGQLHFSSLIRTIPPWLLFLNLLVMFGFSCCTCGLSLVAVSRGYSLVAVHRLLIAVASRISEHGL